MLYPRKIEEVLWHSATSRLAKSILVKMPRLPTIRVIGSQFISTRLRFFLSTSDIVSGSVAMGVCFCLHFCPPSEAPLVRFGLVASGQRPPGMPPFRFFVHRGIGDAAHGADETAVGANDVRGKLGSGGCVHEGHELIGKPRHAASYADAAHIGTAANPAHPSALGYIAVL